MAYRIYISHGSSVELVNNPLGRATLSREKSSNDYGGYYWTNKLSSFTIARKNDQAAYNLVMSIENSVNRCEPMTVEVRRYTNFSTGAYTVVFRGEFSANMCSFNLQNCTIDVTTRVKSIYSCIDKGKDIDFNILSIPNTAEAKVFRAANLLPFSLEGQIEYTAEDMSADPTWASLNLPGVIGSSPGVTEIFFRVYIVNECIGGVSQTPPVGYGQTPDDWIAIDECFEMGDGTQYTKWVMFPPNYVGIYLVSQLSYTDSCPLSTALGQVTIGGNCCSLIFTEGLPGVATITIPNGRWLQDVLLETINFALSGCDYSIDSVKSDFFQWNSEDPISETNYVNGEIHYWKNPMLFQITDVKYYDADEQASICILTFKKLMSDLFKLMNLVWWIETDGTNYYLRIEHLSRAEGSDIVDMSDVKGFKAYAYDTENLAFQLKFSTPVQRNLDFVGSEITFNGACTNESVEKVDTELLCADIDYIQSYSEDTSNDAIVIVACDPDGMIWSTIGNLSGTSQINAPMSWANLHDAFHRHGAHTPTGKINNEDVTFDSTKRIKKQSIKAKNCDLDLHNYSMVTTELGTGEMTTITTALQTGMSEIEVTL